MPSRFWAASGNALLPGSGFFAPAAGGGATTWGTQADWTITGSSLTAERTAIGTFWGLIHASAAKANGTYIVTVNAVGGAATSGTAIGFDTGSEGAGLGSDGSGNSIAWNADGSISYGGSAIVTAGGAVAAWTTGDQLKIVKSGVNFSFYKFITGAWVQQGSTIDSSSATYGHGTILSGAVYPSASSQHATGLKLTADFTGW